MSARRMLCTRCGSTDRPDTRIGGSDLVEVVGWALFLLPGALYCWWRHASRQKVCAHCGSPAVVREARAARERGVETETAGGRLVFAARRLPWLATPRERLRVVRWGGAAALGCTALALVSMNTVGIRPAEPPAKPELQVEDERPSLYARQRQCEQRCNTLHRTQTLQYRECVDRCVIRVASPDAAKECGDLVDAATCEFAAGH
jgi:hypothetical protein